MLRLTLADKPDSISQTEEDILDAMCQAVVVIDKKVQFMQAIPSMHGTNFLILLQAKVILFNKSAERMFGYSRKEVLRPPSLSFRSRLMMICAAPWEQRQHADADI